MRRRATPVAAFLTLLPAGLVASQLVLFASAARAEVKSAGPAGFEIEHSLVAAAPPDAVLAQIGRIGQWWNPAHSYSGKAANLRLELRAGGCFCEQLEGGGSVEHLRVVQVDPHRGVVRLQGGLGPLAAEAVAGTLTWTLKPVPAGTQVTQNYMVSGTIRGGAAVLAPVVDRVLAEQLERLRSKIADGGQTS